MTRRNQWLIEVLIRSVWKAETRQCSFVSQLPMRVPVKVVDQTLAKGLTKRFFKELVPRTYSRINKAIKQSFSARKRKNGYKVAKKIMGSSLSHSVTDFMTIGFPKREAFCFTIFRQGKQSLVDRWEEPSLYSARCALSTRDGSYFDESKNIDWEVSHHAIQRIIQRNTHISEENFEELFRLVTREFQYVNTCSMMLKSFWTGTFFAEAQKDILATESRPDEIKTFLRSKNYLSSDPKLDSITIPGTWGIFRARYQFSKEIDQSHFGPILSIRTYLPIEAIEDWERERWQRSVAFLKPLKRTHLPYKDLKALDWTPDALNRTLELGILKHASELFLELFGIREGSISSHHLESLREISAESESALVTLLEETNEENWGLAIAQLAHIQSATND